MYLQLKRTKKNLLPHCDAIGTLVWIIEYRYWSTSIKVVKEIRNIGTGMKTSRLNQRSEHDY